VVDATNEVYVAETGVTDYAVGAVGSVKVGKVFEGSSSNSISIVLLCLSMQFKLNDI